MQASASEHPGGPAEPPRPPAGEGTSTGRAGVLLAIVVAVALVAHVTAGGDNFQWDFTTYYLAARVMQSGGNPYDVKQLDALAPKPIPLGIVYPPLAIHLFRPFTALPLEQARLAWFGLKVAALLGLFCLWHRRFLPLRADGPTVLFFLLAFNSSLAADLRSGNPAAFESFLLWSGFAWLLRGNPWVLAASLILICQVKAVPVCLVVVFLLVGEKPLWKPFLATGLGSAAGFALNPILYPELTRHFLTAVLAVDERGVLNPSSLSLIRDLSKGMRQQGSVVPPGFEAVVYLGFLLWLGGLSWLAYRAWRRRSGAFDSRTALFFVCVVYGLAMPRFKDYTYELLLLPGLFALRLPSAQKAIPWLAALILFPHSTTNLPYGCQLVFKLANEYLPLLAAFGVWVCYVRELQGPGPGTVKSGPDASP